MKNYMFPVNIIVHLKAPLNKVVKYGNKLVRERITAVVISQILFFLYKYSKKKIANMLSFEPNMRHLIYFINLKKYASAEHQLLVKKLRSLLY